MNGAVLVTVLREWVLGGVLHACTKPTCLPAAAAAAAAAIFSSGGMLGPAMTAEIRKGMKGLTLCSHDAHVSTADYMPVGSHSSCWMLPAKLIA